MGNKIFTEGVFKEGYGLVPKKVMRDKDLSPEAKAIYCYIISYAGAGKTSFPGVNIMVNELNMSRKRYYKHRKQLLNKGYIEIKKNRENGKRANNIYIQKTFPEQQCQNLTVENETVENETVENETTNSNRVIINSSNSKSLIDDEEAAKISKKYNQTFSGTISPTIFDSIKDFILLGINVDMILYAFDLAEEYDANSFRYVEKILIKWDKNDINSLKKAKNNKVNFKNNNRREVADF